MICAADPDATAQLYRSMFGGEAVRPVAGGFSLAMGLSRFDILTPAVVADSFGAATPDAAGCSTYPAALACACVGWTIPTECSKVAVLRATRRGTPGGAGQRSVRRDARIRGIVGKEEGRR